MAVRFKREKFFSIKYLWKLYSLERSLVVWFSISGKVRSICASPFSAPTGVEFHGLPINIPAQFNHFFHCSIILKVGNKIKHFLFIHDHKSIETMEKLVLGLIRSKILLRYTQKYNHKNITFVEILYLIFINIFRCNRASTKGTLKSMRCFCW